MDVNLICGFLGAGKTTLVRRLLTERKTDERLAVIVNEFGQVGIDGQILQGSTVDLIEVSAGCFCCVLRGALVNALEELRDKSKVDRVVIEASGISQPGELVQVLGDPAIARDVTLGPVVAIVDASRFLAHRKVLGGFYLEQVRRAEVLVLNKADLVSGKELEVVRRELHDLNPGAQMLTTTRCDADLEAIMTNVRHQQPEPSALDQGLASPAPSASFVSFVLPAAFDAARPKVEAFFAGLPDTVVRAKGFMRLDGRSHLVQFAAGRLEMDPAAGSRPASVVFICSAAPDRAAIERAFTATRT